jgi:hypothetical protein
MKQIVFISLLLSLLCTGCRDENKGWENLSSLEGTRWKLEGIVDETGALKVLEPKDEKCYTLIFESDTSYSTLSSIGYTGRYKIDYTICSIRIFSFIGPKLPEKHKDGELYCEAFTSAQSISFEKNKLKMYYNNNKNYLLYKLQ